MPPRGVKSSKRKRQYEHIKQSARRRGKSTGRAKEIAARTVNKQRSQAGTTKKSSGGKSRKTGTAGKTTRKSSSRSRSKTSSRSKSSSTRRTGARKKK